MEKIIRGNRRILTSEAAFRGPFAPASALDVVTVSIQCVCVAWFYLSNENYGECVCGGVMK